MGGCFHGWRQSLDMLPRQRKYKLVVASLVSCAIAAALVWCVTRGQFEFVRLRTKSSFVVVSDNDRKTAFALDEQQTRHILNVIRNLTRAPVSRRSVRFRDYVSVFCKDKRSAYLREIWVHPFETESKDVLDELTKIAARGVPEDANKLAGLREDTPTMERVY
jgi:hypothetical protein